jgi:hypothetical protein
VDNDSFLLLIANSLVFRLFAEGLISYEEMKNLQEKNKEILLKKVLIL